MVSVFQHLCLVLNFDPPFLAEDFFIAAQEPGRKLTMAALNQISVG